MNLKTFCITRDIYYEERCVDDPVFHKFYERNMITMPL